MFLLKNSGEQSQVHSADSFFLSVVQRDKVCPWGVKYTGSVCAANQFWQLSRSPTCRLKFHPRSRLMSLTVLLKLLSHTSNSLGQTASRQVNRNKQNPARRRHTLTSLLWNLTAVSHAHSRARSGVFKVMTAATGEPTWLWQQVVTTEAENINSWLKLEVQKSSNELLLFKSFMDVKKKFFGFKYIPPQVRHLQSRQIRVD